MSWAITISSCVQDNAAPASNPGRLSRSPELAKSQNADGGAKSPVSDAVNGPLTDNQLARNNERGAALQRRIGTEATSSKAGNGAVKSSVDPQNPTNGGDVSALAPRPAPVKSTTSQEPVPLPTGESEDMARTKKSVGTRADDGRRPAKPQPPKPPANGTNQASGTQPSGDQPSGNQPLGESIASTSSPAQPAQPPAPLPSTASDPNESTQFRAQLIEEARRLLIPVISQNIRLREPNLNEETIQQRVMALVTDEECLDFVRLAQQAKNQMVDKQGNSSNGSASTVTGGSVVDADAGTKRHREDGTGVHDGVERPNKIPRQAEREIPPTNVVPNGGDGGGKFAIPAPAEVVSAQRNDVTNESSEKNRTPANHSMSQPSAQASAPDPQHTMTAATNGEPKIHLSTVRTF